MSEYSPTDIHHLAWADKMLHDGESDSITPLGLTPEEMYRARWRAPDEQLPKRSQEDMNRLYREEFWGESLHKKRDRDMTVHLHVDKVMVDLLNDPELQHIFTGTAKDFDTIHELQSIVYYAVSESFTDGFAARYFETLDGQTQAI